MTQQIHKMFHVEHNSEDWYNLRLGKITASELDVLITPKGKISESKGVQTYIYKKATEKLINYRKEVNGKALDYGNENEIIAKQEYAFTYNKEIADGNFYYLEDLNFGASPDAVVLENNEVIGILEAKCPYEAPNHMQYISEGVLPDIYKAQVQGQLLATGLKWCDFYSYHPHLKSFCLRIYRDDDYIEKITQAIISCNKKIDKIIENYNKT